MCFPTIHRYLSARLCGEYWVNTHLRRCFFANATLISAGTAKQQRSNSVEEALQVKAIFGQYAEIREPLYYRMKYLISILRKVI
jgi:hypothetical protein